MNRNHLTYNQNIKILHSSENYLYILLIEKLALRQQNDNLQCFLLQLCSKGAALGKPFDAHAEDIASVASFIETKLVTCYLRMRKPDLALNHAHR